MKKERGSVYKKMYPKSKEDNPKIGGKITIL